MTFRGIWRKCAIAALFIGAVGCSRTSDTGAVEAQKTQTTSPIASVPGPNTSTPPVALDPKLHQSFEEACTNELNKDLPLELPPNLTLTGKNCGLLNDSVAKIWDQIKFVDENGKRQTFVAELEVVAGDVELGTIELLMQPEVAPNHVRNFVALATLQYYDGLRFDHIMEQEYKTDDGQAGKLSLVEAGSPTETAEPERSHLGYWVKPEFDPSVKHEEGSVGACLLACEGNEETAAVRFYISLTQAPAMDGNFTIFAKVTKGLDVAKRIAQQPHGTEPGPDQGRPKQPITIRKVTMHQASVQ